MKNNKLKFILCLIISILGYCCGNNSRIVSQQNRIFLPENVLYIKFDRGFTVEEIECFKQTFPLFNSSLGLQQQLVAVDYNSQVFDLTVENTELDLLTTDLGRHMGGNIIRLATNRMSSNHQLKMVFMHEIGHWLGMQHVCIGSEPIERLDECSSVGLGLAIMNPYNNPTLGLRFTELDRREFILHHRQWFH